MIEGWPVQEAARGLAIAREAYGADVGRKLALVVTKLREDKGHRGRIVEALAITDTKTLAAGLAVLARGKWREPGGAE
jgi:hypothetical protein